MAELGVAPIVLGHVANHRTTTKAGVTLGVYVHHQYEREKREALELWADRLQGIISGAAEVVDGARQTMNHKFDDVARTIAKGRPPKWLTVGLEHFSDGIGVDTSDVPFHSIIERMQDAVHVLMTWLPAFGQLPYGMKCPKHVAVALAALPQIKRDLDRASRKPIGRPPDAQRLVCAAVVVKAWKIIHGRPEPRSDKLLQACSDYWRACGGEQIGGSDLLENWRRPVEQVLKADYSWVERVLLVVQGQSVSSGSGRGSLNG
jgi:hypothetical protein